MPDLDALLSEADAAIAETKSHAADWVMVYGEPNYPRNLALALRLAELLDAFRSVQVPEEWDWAGLAADGALPLVGPYPERVRAEAGVEAYNATRPEERHVRLERRRRAGPWEPVPSPGTTTEEE